MNQADRERIESVVKVYEHDQLYATVSGYGLDGLQYYFRWSALVHELDASQNTENVAAT